MGKAVKIAISIPAPILEAAEAERRKRGESRSAFFRRALEAYFRQQREKEDEERYIHGYTEQPEGPEEKAWVQAGLRALAQEPWE